jgi:2-polyprenyl-6-methoxyphenol hydroxylase-like FAD-dependent oxidoreductase
MTHSDVLIVGAGPTGLVLSLWLGKLGVKPRIIDKTSEPGTTSRALAVHARTLELYRQLDLADAVIERGHKVPAVNLWVRGNREARISFKDIGADITPYPFLHIFPQDEHERLLIARLEAMDIAVERRTELIGYSDEGDRIVARLRGAAGGEERCEAGYIAGCDGAHSLVRQTMGTGFPGGTYRQIFYVADVEASGPPLDGELHVDLDEADFLAVFPLAGEGRARLIGTVRDERAEHPEALKFEDVSGLAIDHLKVRVGKVNWFSTYHVHHRVTEHFRKGRAFLLGDAAHIHSPAGGQGMNTGTETRSTSLGSGPRFSAAARRKLYWTATNPSASRSRGAWSIPPIGCSPSQPRKAGSPISSEPVSYPCCSRLRRNSKLCASGCSARCPRSRSIIAILL